MNLVQLLWYDDEKEIEKNSKFSLINRLKNYQSPYMNYNTFNIQILISKYDEFMNTLTKNLGQFFPQQSITSKFPKSNFL